MKTKLLILAITAGIIASSLMIYGSKGLNSPTADELAAQSSAQKYAEEADRHREAAAIYAQTKNFSETAPKLTSVADSNNQLATLESERAARLTAARIHHFSQFRTFGFIFAAFGILFVSAAWIIPTPGPSRNG